jgi:hypothetical protein
LNQGEITGCHSRGQNAQVFFMCCKGLATGLKLF